MNPQTCVGLIYMGRIAALLTPITAAYGASFILKLDGGATSCV